MDCLRVPYASRDAGRHPFLIPRSRCAKGPQRFCGHVDAPNSLAVAITSAM